MSTTGHRPETLVGAAGGQYQFLRAAGVSEAGALPDRGRRSRDVAGVARSLLSTGGGEQAWRESAPGLRGLRTNLRSMPSVSADSFGEMSDRTTAAPWLSTWQVVGAAWAITDVNGHFMLTAHGHQVA